MAIEFERPAPILRSFDEAKAREFYLDYLGFSVDFEHRFEPGMPLYMGISRNGLTLHISEHHGDATPGSTVYIPMSGIDEFHTELKGKAYANLNPSIYDAPWHARVMELADPFGNRLRFSEAVDH